MSKFIIQDRPSVFKQLNSEQKAGFEVMSYGFHTEQQVKDYLCNKILKQIAGEMTPDARLLIVDAVLPAQTEIGGMGHLMDIIGPAIGGKERTEIEAVASSNAEGLELIKVWYSRTSWQAVDEARLKV